MFETMIRLIFGAGMFINAALFIPQAVRILKTKTTEGLSLITFGGLCLIQTSGVAYGYIQHDYMLMLEYFLSLITCISISLLILFTEITGSKNEL